jgi:hypothetical protein
MAEQYARSQHRLHAIGLSTPVDAPISFPTPYPRTPEEIAVRATILFIVATRGAFMSVEDGREWNWKRFTYRAGLHIVWSDDIEILEGLAAAEVDHRDPGAEFLQCYGLWDFVSPDERDFLLHPHPRHHVCVAYAWRSETVQTLLWALGLVATLDSIDIPVDHGEMTRTFLVTPIRERFTGYELRPLPELMDEFDFIRRCHWIMYNARNRGQEPPAILHPYVILGRHAALQWLLNPYGEAWDDLQLSA